MKFKWARVFVRTVQRVLLRFLLWAAYIFGIGLTNLFIFIFNRKCLERKNTNTDSFWEEAKGYGGSDHDVMRQS